MSTWKPGSRGRPPAWAIEKGLHTSKTDIKSPLKTVKTMNKTASIKDSPIKKNTWRPGSRGRVPDWYKEIVPTTLVPAIEFHDDAWDASARGSGRRTRRWRSARKTQWRSPPIRNGSALQRGRSSLRLAGLRG